ncbi:hypothetical protein FJQ54_09040 [Sandaracinobacter neustonicus]|uniref:Uncharacterized protein n=1 Tax=Sandaracinobacter neustonicus TaxID=1715348 RepID=A0A501XKU1_9SPHN|nr:hypothetical protein [Sandaracinobacter neustonicus]TPE61039.1 hypothetical protein FJQ54_09040 [Sandaracinobacter neustonicus]
MSEITTVRLPFVIASLLSLLWLGFGVWAMTADGTGPHTISEAVQQVGILLMPIAAMYALASALQNREHIPVLDKSDALEETEARVSGAAARIDALKESLNKDLGLLASTADLLESRSREAQRLVSDLTTATSGALEASRVLESVLPQAASAAERLRLALGETGAVAEAQADRAQQAARSVADGLDALSARGAQSADQLSQALATLEAQADRGRSQSEAGMRAIRSEADSLFELLENTLTAKREAARQQGEAMSAQINEAYQRLDAMGTAATAQLGERLRELGNQAEAIEGRLKAQGALTESLSASAERAFKLLDARLQHSQDTSGQVLERLLSRVQGVNGELGRIAEPLKDSQAATQSLETAVKSLRETALQTVDVLGETLPARTVDAGRAAETLSAELNGLVSAIDKAHSKAAALAAPIAESRAALEAASLGYAAQREAIEAAGQALVAELQQASRLIGEVEEQTRDTSLAAATRLVDAMARVRDVATQTTGTMREMLDNVLSEAKEALSDAADDAMRRSFAEPIAEKAREAEAAAASAAERTATSMAALANTLKLLEERSTDRVVQFEEARQAELLAASGVLTERLSDASVSIASALGKPMDDADWAQWRKGERGLFNRRAVALLDKREAKELKDLIARDDSFASAARDYTRSFDALVQRFEGQAPALAAALLGSEQGRLAAALSEALEG